MTTTTDQTEKGRVTKMRYVRFSNSGFANDAFYVSFTDRAYDRAQMDKMMCRYLNDPDALACEVEEWQVPFDDEVHTFVDAVHHGLFPVAFLDDDDLVSIAGF